jgi:hypothetical protein
MGSVYKQPYTKKDAKTGKRVKRKTQKWYIEYLDVNGHRTKEPAFRDRTASQQLLLEREKEVELARVGISNPFKKHQLAPLTNHITDFEQELASRENSALYVKTTISRIRKIVASCEFPFITHISASAVQKFLGDLRRRGSTASAKWSSSSVV